MIKVAILSKNRCGKVHTYNALKGYPCHIFVEPQEVDNYKTTYPDSIIVDIGQSNQGIVYVRNFINDYFKANNIAKVVVLDDDIKTFSYKKNPKRVHISDIQQMKT